MGRKRKGEKINGWINLDKPVGITSTQAVAAVRKTLNAQKAGHAGTLDPLASGILPIALGEATKTIPFIQDSLKSYEFEITWGESRNTDDAEGKIIATSDHRPSKQEIENHLPDYTGEIQQTPPLFSAIKVDGQRAYDLARNGETPELKSRTVFIASLLLKNTQTDSAHLEMVCGKGTYVRSIARDLAHDLGTHGYISSLRRTRVGPFAKNNAISLDKFKDIAHSAPREDFLLPMQSALDDIPALKLREEEAARLKNGQVLDFVSKQDFERIEDLGTGQEAQILVTFFEGKPIGLVEICGPKIRPLRIFNL